jgi:TrmH family RNA methyltransferase
VKRIASRDNTEFKALARLVTSAPERRRRGASLIEGPNLVAGCLDAGNGVERFIFSEAFADTAAARTLTSRAPEAPCVVLPEALFARLSTVPSPTGVLALVHTPAGRPVPPDADFCLALEDVQDPGNVGTLLRSAAAAGVGHVLLSHSCAFAWSPKVLRAGQGAHFALNVVEDCDLLAFLAGYRGMSVALAGSAEASVYELDLRVPLLLLVGNEGQGISPALLALAARRARIPMPGRAESLNAAVAGSVALFEAVRQRR